MTPPATWWVIEGRLSDRPWAAIGSWEYHRPSAVERLEWMRSIGGAGMEYRLWRFNATVSRVLEDE